MAPKVEKVGFVELLDGLIKKAKEVGKYSAQSGFDAAFVQHHAEKELEELKVQVLNIVNLKETEQVNNISDNNSGCLCRPSLNLRSTHCPFHGICNCCHGCTCPQHDEPEKFVSVEKDFKW